MPQLKKTYNINTTQQLIDLNQDSKNFKLTFECKSLDPSDKYQILVLSQSQLDTQDSNNLPYKQVSHFISGNITSDQDIYQNYFLIIRSDKNCKVEVTIDKTDIEPNIKNDVSLPVSNKTNKTNKTNKQIPKKKSFLRSSLFLWIIITIIGGVLLYFIFFTKTDNLKNSSVIEHSVHGGSIHKDSVHGGSIHKDSVHGGSIHKGSVHSSSHGGSVHSSSHGGSVHSSSHGNIHSGVKKMHQKKKNKKFSFRDFHM